MPIQFNTQDFTDMAHATSQGGDVWANPVLVHVKRKIKDHYLLTPIPACCYCRRLFVGEFRMVIDIEHVLPQSRFASERFIEQNLNIACKRCNMEVKKSDITFVSDLVAMGTDYYQSSHYKFIHPNLDNYDDHLIRNEFRSGSVILVKYSWKNSKKGHFTYTYFKLHQLEIDMINSAQGISGSKSILSKLKSNLQARLFRLLSDV